MKGFYGLGIRRYTKNQLIKEISYAILSGKQIQICALNVYKMAYLYRNYEFYKVVSKIEILIPDGISVFFLSNILKIKVPERITGVDLILKWDNVPMRNLHMSRF